VDTWLVVVIIAAALFLGGNFMVSVICGYWRYIGSRPPAEGGELGGAAEDDSETTI
jgi:hypothetical protein